MLFRTACMTAGVAALALPAFAGNPKPAIRTADVGQQVEPVRMRSYTLVDGRMVYTSDWIEYNGSSSRSTFQAAFDCAELDLTGGVIGAPIGGIECALAGASSRWYFGATYNNPFVSADITTGAGAEGEACTGLGFGWWWNVGTAEPDNDGDGLPDSRCIIAIGTFEDMQVSCAVGEADDGSNFIDGVILDFAFLEAGNGYYYFAGDLGTLTCTMPADGVGGYQAILAIGDDGAGNLIIPTGIDTTTGVGIATQLMLWGTGDAETPNDGRIGHNEPGQYDDDSPTNGVHDVDDTDPNNVIPLECFFYSFAICPSPQGAMMGFYYKPGGNPCPCVGDLDGDGDRDISDLSSLLSAFGQTGDPGSLGCADTDGDGDVDITDLASLLGDRKSVV